MPDSLVECRQNAGDVETITPDCKTRLVNIGAEQRQAALLHPEYPQCQNS